MNESDIMLAGLFFVLAIVVQVVGVIIADWRNHKRELNRLKVEHRNKIDYLLAETFFKKKLEYFEKIVKFLEDYLLYYTQLAFLINNPQESVKLVNLPQIKELSNKKLIKQKIGQVLGNMREDKLLSLLPAGHSIYLNSGNLPNSISEIVLTHTRLFTLTAQYLKGNLKDNSKKEEIIKLISQNIVSISNLADLLKKDLINVKS